MKTKKIIITSCLMIFSCLMIICASTFALFTEKISMTQHLQAGHLTVSLEREKLITKKLQEDGTLKEETNTDRIDFFF